MSVVKDTSNNFTVVRPDSNTESIRESNLVRDKMQKSSTIIFSIANSMMGPSVLLLPLKFIQVGILTSTGVATVIGYISYHTCNLTHLHTRLDEIEFLTAIQRILGKSWMYIYFLHSFVILWMAGIIYFLSLCDVVYSCIQMIFNVDLPDEGTLTFGTFSFQYIGLILMAMIGWLFFLPKLGKILDLTEKGIYSIITESIFLIFLGFKAIANGVDFASYTDDPTQEVPLTTSKSIAYALGVFAMAFSVHNGLVPIVRKSKNPGKNSRNVGIAYAITYTAYIVTGVFGTIGLYKQSGMNPNTVLNNTLYDRHETATRVLLIITQIMTAFQLVTVLPVVNNIVRTQLFITIWGENVVPPKAAFIGFNIVYIVTFLVVQICNISPNTVMAYGGAFIGFVIMYLVPVGIHLKSLRDKQMLEKQGYSTLNDENSVVKPQNFQIASFLMKKTRINYIWEYGVHIAIMGVGVYIFILQLLSVF